MVPTEVTEPSWFKSCHLCYFTAVPQPKIRVCTLALVLLSPGFLSFLLPTTPWSLEMGCDGGTAGSGVGACSVISSSNSSPSLKGSITCELVILSPEHCFRLSNEGIAISLSYRKESNLPNDIKHLINIGIFPNPTLSRCHNSVGP